MNEGDTKDHAVLTCLNMQFPLDKSVLPPRARKLLRTGAYEAKEAIAAQKLIRKGDVVMELGGGIGFMSTLVATRTPARAVHAFEANPALIPYIEQVHAINGAKNAAITHCVLGDRDGTVPFYVRPNFLSSSMSPLDEDGPEVQKIDVPMLNVNRVMADLRPSVLICDIEGAEVDLLPRMDLSSLRAVLIETHPQWIGKAGIRKVFRCLDDAGLVFFPRWSHGKVAVFRSDW